MAQITKGKKEVAQLRGFELLTDEEADEVATSARTREAKYPFSQMEVNQGVFIPAVNEDGEERDVKSLRNTLYSSANRQGVRVKVAIATRNGVEGCKVVRMPEKEKKEVAKAGAKKVA